MTDIQKDIKELREKSVTLEEEINIISDTIYKGNDSILPLSIITHTLSEIKSVIDKHTECINKISQEDVNSRNQIKYMFLVLLITALGKIVLNIPYVKGLIGQ